MVIKKKSKSTKALEGRVVWEAEYVPILIATTFDSTSKDNKRHIKLTKDYDAEVMVSSKGDIIYHCSCGSTLYTSLKEINFTNPFITCYPYPIG